MISGTFLARPNRLSTLTVDANLDMGAYTLKCDNLSSSASTTPTLDSYWTAIVAALGG